MGRPKHTYEQLHRAHRNNTKLLSKNREDLKHWKARAKAAEYKLRSLVVVDDKPDYYWSMSGFPLFRAFYLSYGLTPGQVEVLMMISYMKTFFQADAAIFRDGRMNIPIHLGNLIKLRYVSKVTFPPKDSHRRIYGYVLAQRGKDLIEHYKKHYDEKMADIRAGKATKLGFAEGCYYENVRLNKYFRRKEKRAAMGEQDDLYTDNDFENE